MIQSMLVATDGSETAGKAVDQAAQLAAATGARVHVITAYRARRSRVSSGRAVDPEVADWHLGQDAGAESILDAACATFRMKGLEAEPHARSGDAADAIIGLAEELGTDLVVIGNKGLGSKRRLLLGSVPNKVSHHAPCSVLIVRTT